MRGLVFGLVLAGGVVFVGVMGMVAWNNGQ